MATSLTPGQNQNDVRARDVSYQYGDVDPERLTELRHASGAQQGQAYATYTYDAAGNQTQRSIVGEANWEYVYDGQDRLRRVVKKSPAGVVQGSEEYWYTTSGQRMLVQKRDAAGAKTELLWFIGDTQAHYDANGNVTKVYAHVSLGTPVARVERTANATTNLEYQFHGLANNTIATVATDGTVNTNLVYAPYGELVSATESGNGAGLAAHWRRFNDKFKDEISGLGYYGARYYDNVALGWTQADPKYRVVPDAKAFAPRRANLYAFVLGNPLKYLDPDGLDGEERTRFEVVIRHYGSNPKYADAAATGMRAAGDVIRSGDLGELQQEGAHRANLLLRITYDSEAHPNPDVPSADLTIIIIDPEDEAAVAAADAETEFLRADKGVLFMEGKQGGVSQIIKEHYATPTGGAANIGSRVAVIWVTKLASSQDPYWLAAYEVNHEGSHAMGLRHGPNHRKGDYMYKHVVDADAWRGGEFTSDDRRMILDMTGHTKGAKRGPGSGGYNSLNADSSTAMPIIVMGGGSCPPECL